MSKRIGLKGVESQRHNTGGARLPQRHEPSVALTDSVPESSGNANQNREQHDPHRDLADKRQVFRQDRGGETQVSDLRGAFVIGSIERGFSTSAYLLAHRPTFTTGQTAAQAPLEPLPAHVKITDEFTRNVIDHWFGNIDRNFNSHANEFLCLNDVRFSHPAFLADFIKSFLLDRGLDNQYLYRQKDTNEGKRKFYKYDVSRNLMAIFALHPIPALVTFYRPEYRLMTQAHKQQLGSFEKGLEHFKRQGRPIGRADLDQYIKFV